MIQAVLGIYTQHRYLRFRQTPAARGGALRPLPKTALSETSFPGVSAYFLS